MGLAMTNWKLILMLAVLSCGAAIYLTGETPVAATSMAGAPG